MGELPLLLFFFGVQIQESKSESGCSGTSGRKPSFCTSFDGKCPKAAVLVEGPHFEQLSMDNVRNRFFSKIEELRGSSGGSSGGAPGSSGELRGAPGSSGELREKLRKNAGNSHFSGGTAARSF